MHVKYKDALYAEQGKLNDAQKALQPPYRVFTF